MPDYRFFLLIAVASLVLVGSRCTPTPVEQVLPVAPEPSTLSGEGEDLVGTKFVAYANRAQGYTILRPDNWYWRHYISSEIGDRNPTVVDYFMTDPEPLPGLGSEHLGQIVIEVSARPLSDYAAAVADLAHTEATVAGQPTSRYQGRRSNKVGESELVVEYHFSYHDKTIRLRLTAPVAAGSAEDIFETVVASFKFVP